jgi:hypothetical protein
MSDHELMKLKSSPVLPALFVVALVICAMSFAPPIPRAKKHAQRIQCVNNICIFPAPPQGITPPSPRN